MSKFENITGRAAELASQLGEDLKAGKAMKWIETGAALGAVRAGTRAATRFARRNPALAVAAAAGAGLLWYAARQRANKQADAPIEGQSRRIEAKRATARHRGI